ncbi:precorrin-4 C(11)-methyltransferase [Streptomyces sp. WAC 05379]|uniref:cobalt-precorrin-4/precorrin-4 C(11)-methyltransferase n=1 Tax=Streptomyces sp. WAC 05379 TaxID=2203207 RepID=UPI000F74224E|nr:SAM-dependent methyltransferase [Streptomyces sp. WAC 05379]RSO05282.1 precorrin-4 C(11)-methyltransferase [Streptomyces sp. WAC 05379]
MTVYFIGAGPGAADLITIRGREVLGRCGVCLYPGSMTPIGLLTHCPPDATRIDTASLSLDEVMSSILEAHEEGVDVARLCSGDPSLYSTVAEQMRVLDKSGVPHEMVPGVSAFAASAAVLGRELTVPGVGQSLIITRARSRSGSMPAGETLTNFARTGATLAVYLVINHLEDVVAELLPHYGGECPAAAVAMASQPGETVVRSTLSCIASDVRAAGMARLATLLVGRTLEAEGFACSALHSAARDWSA